MHYIRTILAQVDPVWHTQETIKTCFLLISNYKMSADQRSFSAELLTGLSVRQSITEDGLSKNWWKRLVQYWLSQQAKRLKSNGVCPASHWQPLLLILLSRTVLSFDLFCASWMSFFKNVTLDHLALSQPWGSRTSYDPWNPSHTQYGCRVR